jgi:hypothetical protein
MSDALTVSLAPDKLWQAINPLYAPGAQFGLFNVSLGSTSHPDVERTILEDVGSYGRQLGRIGDALEVILKHVKLDGLTPAEKDALSILEGQLASVRQVKQRALKGPTDLKGSIERTLASTLGSAPITKRPSP